MEVFEEFTLLKKNQIYKNWFQELRIARLNSIKIEKGRCRIKLVRYSRTRALRHHNLKEYVARGGNFLG